uniref:Uncharacterized protein n=1 Tax=Anguilla anguilla TaxID=7936 RepID=A0A0E9UPD4_ANGAN
MHSLTVQCKRYTKLIIEKVKLDFFN